MHAVRVRFEKTGDAKYISHLDLNRVFFRSVRRGNIPVWYTEGYNPRPHITYLLSLPLGIESKCENIDLKIEDDELLNEEIKNRFNSVLPEGINVLSVGEPKMKMNDIYSAVYDFEYLTLNPETDAEKIKNILDSGELLGTKKAKRGKIKVNVEFNVLDSVITYKLSQIDNGFKLRVLCLAGQTSNLNPVLLSQCLEEKSGINYESKNIDKLCVLNDEYKMFE